MLFQLFIEIKNPLGGEGFYLDDQHGIAITEETIFILDRFFIRFHDQVVTGEGTSHNQ